MLNFIALFLANLLLRELYVHVSRGFFKFEIIEFSFFSIIKVKRSLDKLSPNKCVIHGVVANILKMCSFLITTTTLRYRYYVLQ